MSYDKVNRKSFPGTGIQARGGEHFPIREVNADGSVLPVFVSPMLAELPGVSHCFTTREGGVSEGIFRSLNLSFRRGDETERVEENYRRVASAFGAAPDRIVCTDQTHTANIRVATEADAGKGVTKPRDYTDVDGLVTNVPGLILGVFVADCVPVLLADPATGAVGAVHSGWRGTAAQIGAGAVRLMEEQYGTRAEDLICAVGPSICRDCYEVSEDVAVQFEDVFAERSGEAVFYKGKSPEGEPKYLVDLWQANRIVLEEAGVLPEHISVTDVCTACNCRLLFSHRASHGRRGNLGAFIMREHK
ncbi:MAG: peptidoglycan editing factor PgeF [Lachnospiraceae bacterium]|nr:peptidoglycan editing factor PgeF [Lachnospiraceae bacterium]